MMKKWKEKKGWSMNTQWFSGDNDSLFTPEQGSVPEEGDEVSCPSHAVTGGTFSVKHLRGDYLLKVGIWTTSAFLSVNKALANAGKHHTSFSTITKTTNAFNIKEVWKINKYLLL